MRKLLMILMLGMILLSFASAEQDSLGTYKQGEDIVLLQLCGTCTYVNITSIVLPNSTHLPIDEGMTIRGAEYTYNFSQTDLLGTYSVNGVADKDGVDDPWAYELLVTPNGKSLTQAEQQMFGNGIWIMIVLFTASLIGLFKFEFPSGKLACYWICHISFLVTMFSAWQFMGGFATQISGLSGIFKVLFYVSAIAIFPMVILSIVWVVFLILFNKTFMGFMERGLDEQTAIKKTKEKHKLW